MDERLIAQALQDQAREDIPEDMNLIPEVYERLGRATRTAARSRLSWVAAAVLGMLAVSVVAFAAARLLQDTPRDPGLQGASEADLVTELDLTQTIEGVTLTLDYAYADANRISIGYGLSGTAPQGTSYQDAGQRLTDSTGHEFVPMFGGGGGGGGGGSEDPQNIAFASYTTASFDVPLMEDAPDELNLRLEVNVNRLISTRPDDAGTPQPVEGAPIIEPLEPFVFEFSVPLIEGQSVEVEQSVSANEITLSLERLVITPSLTRGVVCFAPPPDNFYIPLVSLSIDGEAVEIEQEQAFIPLAEDESGACFDLQIKQSLYNLPGEWTLGIDALARYLQVSYSSGSNGTTADYRIEGAPDQLALVRAELEPGLQAYGIELTETDESLSFSFDLNGEINASEQHEINGLINDAVRAEIPGPWVFSFDVPPAQ